MKHSNSFVFSFCFLLAAGLTWSNADMPVATAAPKGATTRTTSKPGLKRVRSLPKFDLQKYRANNVRYVTNMGVYLQRLTPTVYDVKTGKSRTLPFLKRLGKRWHTARLVYYDVLKGAAGLLVTKRPGVVPSTTHHTSGARYQRLSGLLWFCRRCNKVVRLSFKAPKSLQTFYAHVSLKRKRILWKVRLSGKALQPLGVDLAGKYFMAYRKLRRKTRRGTTQTVTLVRVNLAKKKVDWTYTVKLPTRSGRYTSLMGDASLNAATDLGKVLIREYDEKSSSKPNGYLHSPKARGVIVDVASSTQVTFTAPVSSYGAVFSSRNRYLYLTSHQRGRIYKIDARTGKYQKSVYNGYGAYGLLLSKTGRYLYCVHFSGVNVYDPVTLKRVKSIALRKLFPGHRKLLSLNRFVALTSGHLLLNMLRRPRRGLSSTSASHGFVHFKVME